MENRTSLSGFDPRTILVSFLALGAAAAVSGSPWVLGYAGAAAAAGSALTGMTPRDGLRLLRRTWLFLTAIFLVALFGTGGRVLFTLGDLHATAEGLRRGLTGALRLGIPAWLAAVFLRATGAGDRVDLAEYLFRPVERRLPGLTQVFLVALSFAPMMVRSARRLRTAQRARGASPAGGIRSGLRLAASAVLPQAAGAMRQAEDLGDAMASRGYRPGAPRSPFRRFSFRKRDTILLAALLLPLLLLLLLAPTAPA
jgi:energy-coupling factor transport system permease protein